MWPKMECTFSWSTSLLWEKKSNIIEFVTPQQHNGFLVSQTCDVKEVRLYPATWIQVHPPELIGLDPFHRC